MSDENKDVLTHRVSTLESNQEKIIDKLENVGSSIMEHVIRCDEQKKADAKAREKRDQERDKKDKNKFWWIIGGIFGTGGVAGHDELMIILKTIFGG